uniref:Uncharacterized protein n=1 Tax=Fibrocapsa japonica TaxID=94617 RepID=A0A7S2XYC9_9STRA|mmetsp:Transcript_21362/g.30975  ORF Transcript_21362/g.30975 Transcript_21362/m.30975 type:complete len:178 (+) Transcript_21362:104-637(+)|eukprot:CAMPEP_0113944888 /NCGR_PEP_ID=MMETSP1339-20121228/37568_1 /TAXON_ID=94617 /ORGANISM="Fibrocapsa japonica" /LENGTH=177 /DNA_ID=CAMNT_0000950237 /DNA_START=52 /DNA_END=585 /DNA_ORIENTATION=+ /assembly_acc=CAM_ASM_000762
MASTSIVEFITAVDQAYTQIKEAENLDQNSAFAPVFSYDDIRDDEERADKLNIGGDPTLDVKKLVRKFSDPIKDLGYARVLLRDEEEYGIGEIDKSYEDLYSPPSSPSWSKFEAVRDYFAMNDLDPDMQSPAAYAAFIGILEEPIAVLVRTAWGNGCCLKALLCTEGHVYVIKSTNG